MALVKCAECGKEVSEAARQCPNCGYSSGAYRGQKSKGLAIFLAFFFGGLGIHKFYLGKPGWGILYFLFFWTFIPLILSIIEAIIMLFRDERKFSGAVTRAEVLKLKRTSSGEVVEFYKQPAVWAVAGGLTLLIIAINLAS
jgi:TM2 domain-containing membrane protein YozV